MNCYFGPDVEINFASVCVSEARLIQYKENLRIVILQISPWIAHWFLVQGYFKYIIKQKSEQKYPLENIKAPSIVEVSGLFVTVLSKQEVSGVRSNQSFHRVPCLPNNNHFHSRDSLHLLRCDAASLVFAEHSETLLVVKIHKYNMSHPTQFIPCTLSPSPGRSIGYP